MRRRTCRVLQVNTRFAARRPSVRSHIQASPVVLWFARRPRCLCCLRPVSAQVVPGPLLARDERALCAQQPLGAVCGRPRPLGHPVARAGRGAGRRAAQRRPGAHATRARAARTGLSWPLSLALHRLWMLPLMGSSAMPGLRPAVHAGGQMAGRLLLRSVQAEVYQVYEAPKRNDIVADPLAGAVSHGTSD